MGFLANLGALGKKAAAYTRIGVGKLRKVKDFISKGINHTNTFIDHVLDYAHNTPLLADLALQFENHENYQRYRNISQEIGDILANSDVIFDSIQKAAETVDSVSSHLVHPLNPGGAPVPRPSPYQVPSVGVTM